MDVDVKIEGNLDMDNLRVEMVRDTGDHTAGMLVKVIFRAGGEEVAVWLAREDWVEIDELFRRVSSV